MLRFGLNTFSGMCIGIVLGMLLGGGVGYFYMHANYAEAPNGNPTEVAFYRLLVNGSSIFFGIVCAGFGSVFGAIFGASIGAVAGVLTQRNKATSKKSNNFNDQRSPAEPSGARKSLVSPEH
jgi:Na+/glutamate symporter